MAVSNGQLANQNTFNNAFMSRTVDTSTVGIVNLANGSPASGSAVANIQQAHNETFDAVGMTGISDTTRKDYSSNNVLSNGDSHKTSLGKLDAEFDSSTGHSHSGAAGDGKPISASTLTNINNFWAVRQSITATSASGTSTNISSLMSGKTAGGSASVLGVITTGALNKVILYNPTTMTNIEDAGGQRVYGRITEAAGVWTLSYYTNESGTETAHTLSSQDVYVIYLEVFSQNTRPTFGSEPNDQGTLDITGDVVDASSSQRGLISTGAQSIAGVKTLVDTTQSTTKDNGALVLEGGLGVEKNINAGGNINSTGTVTGSNLSGTHSGTSSGTNTGDASIGAVGSTPNANGGAFTGQVLNLQPADATNPGVVSILTQTFGGRKNFAAALEAQAQFYGSFTTDAATTGSNATLATPGTLLHRVTNGSLVSIQDIPAASDEQMLILRNATGNTITLKNTDTGSTSVLTGTGADMTLVNKSAVLLMYDTVSSRWQVVGGSGGGGAGSGTTWVQDLSGSGLTGLINGSNTAFTLSATPAQASSVSVFVNGVRERLTTHYSLSGTTLTFVTAPATDDTIEVTYIS